MGEGKDFKGRDLLIALIWQLFKLFNDNRTSACTPQGHFRSSQLSSLVSNLIPLREYVPIYIGECHRRKPHHLRRRLRQVESMKRILRSL